MPKAGKNTNAEPMNVQEYNAEKIDLLQSIRELFEKIKNRNVNFTKLKICLSVFIISKVKN